jgi:hypothetical protein
MAPSEAALAEAKPAQRQMAPNKAAARRRRTGAVMTRSPCFVQRAMEERFEGLLRLDAGRTATSKQHVNRSGSAGRRASK